MARPQAAAATSWIKANQPLLAGLLTVAIILGLASLLLRGPSDSAGSTAASTGENICQKSGSNCATPGPLANASDHNADALFVGKPGEQPIGSPGSGGPGMAQDCNLQKEGIQLSGPDCAGQDPGTDQIQIQPFKNCNKLNRKYPHGVARGPNAVDNPGPGGTLTGQPLVNAKLYQVNALLDVDRDGLVCEA